MQDARANPNWWQGPANRRESKTSPRACRGTDQTSTADFKSSDADLTAIIDGVKVFMGSQSDPHLSPEVAPAPQEDANYRRVAELEFHRLLELHEFSLKMMGDYGRWLISSLLFLHGAAIGGLLFKSGFNGAPPYLNSLWWFVAGIVLAMGAGFAAWLNFSKAAEIYHRWADHRMLTNRAFWPTDNSGSKVVSWTKRIAILCGIVSVGCLVGGAASVVASWH